MTVGNRIKQYDMMIDQVEEQIQFVREHTDIMNTTFDRAKKDFNSNIIDYMAEMKDYTNALVLEKKHEK